MELPAFAVESGVGGIYIITSWLRNAGTTCGSLERSQVTANYTAGPHNIKWKCL